MPYSDKQKQKEYHRKYYKEYYERRREYHYERNKKRTESIRNYIRELKSTLACIKCGENHPGCLEFHHRNPKTKTIEISLCDRLGWSIKRIQKEIAKCDVLCANCHKKLHWEERSSS